MTLCIKNLTVSFEKKRVLDGLCLQVATGEVVALLGCNGIGKSTLLKSLVGVIGSKSDEISVGGKQLGSCTLKERARLLGYMPQHTLIGQSFTVREFLVMGVTPQLGLFGEPQKVHYIKVDTIMNQLGLEHLAARMIDSLSGGERQLVYIGRILVQDAKWMILDEPTASLDYKRQHELLGQLRDIAHKTGKGILFSVHDPNLALNYADRLLIMDEGVIVGDFKIDKQMGLEPLTLLLRKIYHEQLEILMHNNTHIILWE